MFFFYFYAHRVKRGLRKHEQRVKPSFSPSLFYAITVGMTDSITPFTRIGGLYTKLLPEKGHGLFCSEPIEKGAVIETAPGLVMTGADLEKIDQTFLYNYYFSALRLPDYALMGLGITDKAKAGLLGLGLLSLCNHADRPNAVVEKEAERGRVLLTLRALRSISAEEEIAISYGAGWNDKEKSFRPAEEAS